MCGSEASATRHGGRDESRPYRVLPNIPVSEQGSRFTIFFYFCTL